MLFKSVSDLLRYVVGLRLHLNIWVTGFLRLSDNICFCQNSSQASLVIEDCLVKLCKGNYRETDPTRVTLQAIASKMVELKHSLVYKNFYALIVFLLTLPVTSASCERAHSKVDLVKSAVRASMDSERLEDLVLISSEKHS